MRELFRLFQKSVEKTIDNRGRAGVLGKADGTVQYTTESGAAHRNLVWVRIVTDAGVTLVVAENSGVPLQPGLPVRVADVNGTETVIGVDVKKANIFTGGFMANLPEHAWTHGRFGPDPLYITGPTFLPLMARPTNPVDMTVTVEEGWYRWKGDEKVWEEGISANLAAYVPTNQGLQHFIILCLDRDTNALAVIDGIDKGTPIVPGVPFITSEVLTQLTGIDDARYPICAIRFYYGQTSIKAPDIFKDLRLWGSEVLFTPDMIMTDGNGNIMVDGNGDVMVESY